MCRLGDLVNTLKLKLGGLMHPPSPVTDTTEGMDFMPPVRASLSPVYTLPWSEVFAMLTELRLVPMVAAGDLPDAQFYFTTLANWRHLVKYLTYPAEFYAQQERLDCDDYSKKASADSSFYYGLNCLQVWGDTPDGMYHAFNMVLAYPREWRIFEPNAIYPHAGALLKLRNKYGWIARKWKP